METLFSKKFVVEVECLEDVDASTFPKKPFITIVETDFGNADPDALWDLANKLIEAKVMWVAAIGNECTIFDDTVDEAFIFKYLDDLDAVPHVMTTWHNNETIDDVVEFMSFNNPIFEEWKVSKYDLLILRIKT